jgi:hypothetical protein
MQTNFDFGRSTLLAEQYQREMEPITAALLEESQEERDERLSLVEHSWSLSCSCFHTHLEPSEQPIFTSLVPVHP